MSDSDWLFVGELSALTEDEPLSVKVNDVPVGIFEVDGDVYAIGDVCPHADALLSLGFVDGDTVECPLHGALFHIPSGKCTRGPAERDVTVYATKVEDGKIYVLQQG